MRQFCKDKIIRRNMNLMVILKVTVWKNLIIVNVSNNKIMSDEILLYIELLWSNKWHLFKFGTERVVRKFCTADCKIISDIMI